MCLAHSLIHFGLLSDFRTDCLPTTVPNSFFRLTLVFHFLFATAGDCEKSLAERERSPQDGKEKEGEEQREGTRSRSSSTSSEDYIIILPDCFDTSRPLGDSMYRYDVRKRPHTVRGDSPLTLFSSPANSSALSQPGDAPPKSLAEVETASPGHPGDDSCQEGEEEEKDEEAAATPPGATVSGTSSANDMLCTSQTLDDEPLTPEVVAPPKAAVSSR